MITIPRPNFVMALIAVCLSAFSSAASETVYFPGGKVPDKPALANPNGSPVRALVVVEGAQMYSSYAADGRPLSTKAGYRDVVTLYDRYGTDWLLVKSEAGSFAWMHSADLLQTYLCKKDRQQGTFIKATLRNNWRVDGAIGHEVSIRKGPSPTYDVLETYGLADILFVFDERQTSAGRYYLLGAGPSWTYQLPLESIRGWVRAEECTFWNSRVAVYFNRQNADQRANARAQIFEKEEYLADFEKGGTAKGVLATETARSAALLNYRTNRFPVIEARNPHLKIGFIGELPGAVRIAEQTVLGELENLHNMQILFVIDATISMKAYLPDILAGIRDYISQLDGPQQVGRHHFAASVYRDYSEGPKVSELLADFGDTAMMDKLRAVAFSTDNDYPEAVFNGIVQPVSSVHWTPGMVREVVLIGDHGNHPNDGSKTASWVAEKLRQSGVRFHAVNIDVVPKTREFAKLFQDQVRDIARAKSESPDLRIVKSPDNLRAEVSKTLGSIFSFSRKLTETADRCISGDGNCLQESDVEVSAYLKQLLNEKGIGLSQLNLAKYQQVSEEGWISSSYKDKRQVEPWVYISRTELDEFIGALAGIIGATSEQDPAEAIKLTIGRLSGDPLTEHEKLDHYLKRRFGIPLREDSHVLQYSPDDLKEKLQHKEFYIQFRHDLGFSYECLRLFAQERKSPETTLRWDQQAVQWKANTTDLPKEDTWVKTRSGSTYAWVPLKYMP